MMENLTSIQKNGIDVFIKTEDKKWKCKVCGSRLSAHRDFCLNCKTAIHF